MDNTESLYSRLGGGEGLRKFVDNLYDFMDGFPILEEIRKVYPDDLTDSRDQLFMLLNRILGGSSLYFDRYGLPFVKQRCIPPNMSSLAREQWMFCAHNAVNQLRIDSFAREELMSELAVMADQLSNHEALSTEQLYIRNNAIH